MGNESMKCCKKYTGIYSNEEWSGNYQNCHCLYISSFFSYKKEYSPFSHNNYTSKLELTSTWNA